MVKPACKRAEFVAVVDLHGVGEVSGADALHAGFHALDWLDQRGRQAIAERQRERHADHCADKYGALRARILRVSQLNAADQIGFGLVD